MGKPLLRPFPLGLACALTAATVLVADSYPRSPGIDVLHYRFELDLTDETDEILGRTTISLRANEDGVAPPPLRPRGRRRWRHVRRLSRGE